MSILEINKLALYLSNHDIITLGCSNIKTINNEFQEIQNDTQYIEIINQIETDYNY